MIPGSCAAPHSSEEHPRAGAHLRVSRSPSTLGHWTCGGAQSPQSGSRVRPAYGGCTTPPATDTHPGPCLATRLGTWGASRSWADGEAASSLSQCSPSFLSRFCLGVIHFLLVTALLFSILSSSAFLISCKFLYNHTLPHKHEIITDNFSSCAGIAV